MYQRILQIVVLNGVVKCWPIIKELNVSYKSVSFNVDSRCGCYRRTEFYIQCEHEYLYKDCFVPSMYSSWWYNSFYYNEHCDIHSYDSDNIDFTDLLKNNDQDYPELGLLSQITENSMLTENESTISKIGTSGKITYSQVINMCTSVVSTIQGSKVHMEKLFTAMEYLLSILRKGYNFEIEISSLSTILKSPI